MSIPRNAMDTYDIPKFFFAFKDLFFFRQEREKTNHL